MTKAWCADCNVYQMTTQKKQLINMPNFMCINANVVNEQDLGIWLDEGTLILTRVIYYICIRQQQNTLASFNNCAHY